MTQQNQFETTLFVNIDDKEFIGYFGNEPYQFNAGEERQVVKFVATHLAKHLLDRILQEKYSIKNTMADTEFRRGLMAKVLPEEAVRKNIKPLTPEEEKKALEDVLNKQAELIKEIQSSTKHLEEKLSDRKDLEKKIEDLEKELQKVIKTETKTQEIKKSPGRPKKALPVSPVLDSPTN